MSDYSSPAGMVEPELLVATCSADGTVLSRNTAWVTLLGGQEDLWFRLQNEDSEIARQNLKEASRGSLVTHALFMVDRVDRDIPTPLLLHFIPVEKNSLNTASSVAIAGEILSEPSTWTESQTQRHRMETLGRMTMGMAHDFNNLLSGIMGHIELWRLEGPGKASTHLDTIEQAARDGADLISKVQRYIRQEAQSSFHDIDLTALIEECISFTKPYWFNEPRQQGIDISVISDIPSLPPIEGSAAELRDVFVNLILNAVHALPSGGKVVFGGKHSENTVEVTVTDDGTGMTPDTRKQVFEPLYTTKGERGTGMGLAVAAGTIREHGGSISVSSELGEGTTFKLTFPIFKKEEAGPAIQRDSPSSNASKRILVVDDEEMVLNVISRLLTLRGHDVTSAASGREAMERFAAQDFDCILTDQGMPEMSGRELAYQIRKMHPKIPIVLLTGDTDLRFDPTVINLVMTKPFKIDELLSALSSLS